jgi:hypothetical protein
MIGNPIKILNKCPALQRKRPMTVFWKVSLLEQMEASHKTMGASPDEKL